MMHYAETVGCRVQVIRAYFGDPEGEPCGRCDNCEHPAMEAAHQGSTEIRSPQPELSLVATDPHRAGQPQVGAGITRIETMHGAILTTAPETLPQSSAAPTLSPGAEVTHKRFGPGKVRDVHNDVALVRFRDLGEKKVKLEFLSVVA